MGGASLSEGAQAREQTPSKQAARSWPSQQLAGPGPLSAEASASHPALTLPATSLSHYPTVCSRGEAVSWGEGVVAAEHAQWTSRASKPDLLKRLPSYPPTHRSHFSKFCHPTRQVRGCRWRPLGTGLCQHGQALPFPRPGLAWASPFRPTLRLSDGGGGVPTEVGGTSDALRSKLWGLGEAARLRPSPT